MYIRLICSLLIAVFLPLEITGLAQSTAQYVLTFESTWSASTHPEGFPPNPHFSGLIGATHDSTITFWAPDSIASAGIESMAETGSKFALTSIVNDAIDAGQAQFLLSGSGIGTSPNDVTFFFDVSSQFPQISLVSMLAPSPDWFVGVHGLTLFENGAWIDEIDVDLFVYDAGTDSGPNYTSSDQDTQPKEPIFLIEQAPFLLNNEVEPIGTFSFRLVQGVNVESPDDIPNALQLSHGFPNPFSATSKLTLIPNQSTHYRIEVFDMLGRSVDTLLDAPLTAGNVIPLTVDGRHLPPGPYIVRASGGEATTSRIIVLIK